MTDKKNPCKVCGSQSENFDSDYCSLDCYEKRSEVVEKWIKYNNKNQF